MKATCRTSRSRSARRSSSWGTTALSRDRCELSGQHHLRLHLDRPPLAKNVRYLRDSDELVVRIAERDELAQAERNGRREDERLAAHQLRLLRPVDPDLLER